MNFQENIINYTTRILKIKESIHTEEATKTSLIMPFFQLLGYDVFNPHEFIPEYTADVGIKKGEKVDYAIVLNDEVTILIEAKSINEKLEKHDSQLFRYFGTSKAKFAILTNGVIYRFYTDLEKPNVMDSAPFLTLDLEHLKESDILELSKFRKENFDISSIVSTASDLKYFSLIKNILKEEFIEPSDEFIKMILNKNVYDGVKTSNVIEKYRPIVKKSINVFLNDCINERLKNAMNKDDNTDEVNTDEPQIITTVEELESYYTIKGLLCDVIDVNRITYKDTISYFGILIDNKTTKWLCRVFIKDSISYIIIPDKAKKEQKYVIEKISDIYTLKDKLLARLEDIR